MPNPLVGSVVCHGLSSGLPSVPMVAGSNDAACAAPDKKELLSVAVPTTLQGTHDQCGGVVVFRPAMHRRELLAGNSVTLTAACRECGATLSTQWALPTREPVAWQHATQPEDLVAPPLPKEPTPADDPWESAARAVDRNRPPAHRAPDREPKPARSLARSAPALGDAGAGRVQTAAEAMPTAAIATSQAPQPAATEADPAMARYMAQFSERVEAARSNLHRMNSVLPEAVEDAAGSFRTPQLSRRDGLPPQMLAAATSLRAPEPAAPEIIPVLDPVVHAIDHAIVSPTFLDDVATPAAAPAVEPAPIAPAAHIAVEPAPLTLPPALEPPLAEPPAPPPAPALAPALAATPPLVAPAPAHDPLSGGIASTDSDVFPPGTVPQAPTEFVVPPAQMPFATPELHDAAATSAQIDGAANVWDELPVHVGAAAAPVVMADGAAPIAPAALDPAPEQPAPLQPFEPVVEASLPAIPMPLHIAPTAAVVAPASAELAPAVVEAEIAFEPDRGFDWGPEDGAESTGKKPKLSRRARRASKDALSLPAGVTPLGGAAPEMTKAQAKARARERARAAKAAKRGATPTAAVSVAAEPADEVAASGVVGAKASRSKLGPLHIVLIVFAAILIGVSGMKIASTSQATPDDSAASASADSTATKDVDIAPAGGEVADAGTAVGLAGAAAETAENPNETASTSGTSQVPASAADRSDATAPGTANTDPFARPE